ncbi:hypothetical protein Tco_1369125 [Tanacetum coccineum]
MDYHQTTDKDKKLQDYAATMGILENFPFVLDVRTKSHWTLQVSVNIMQINAQKQIIRPQESILRDELAFVHFRIPTLETTLEDIQVSSESSSI